MPEGEEGDARTSCSDISELVEKYWRNCPECKKLFETIKFARNRRSCQKVAEQLVESPNQEPIKFDGLLPEPIELVFWSRDLPLKIKPESTGAPGRGTTCYLSDFNETWLVIYPSR